MSARSARSNPDGRVLDERWIELVRDVQLRAPIDAGEIPWRPDEIVLTKGCDARPHEATYCERLIAALPESRVVDRRDVAHNRVPVPGDNSLDRLNRGKRTLVLGAIGTPVSRNSDPEAGAGTLCTNYYAVHPTWFCFYNCAFCYLCGSPGIRFSPTVRIFVNLQDVLAAMSRALVRSTGTISFYVGKVQDGLQLDPLANFSRVLIPFVRAHDNAHIVFLTKSDTTGHLLTAASPTGREARGLGPEACGSGSQQEPSPRANVALSWSLSPPEVARRFEWGAPPLDRRLMAARRCADAGLEVRFVFMPIIPVVGWREAYSAAIRSALEAVTPARITLGGICSYPGALSATKARLGPTNLICRSATSKHGRRMRFSPSTRAEIYQHMITEIRGVAPGVPVSLCLESADVWRMAGLDPRDCRCNCIAGSWDLSQPDHCDR